MAAKFRKAGFLLALAAAFSAGTQAGIKYAKDHYVSKDRKFIDGKVVEDKNEPPGN